jgi:glycosyltransferase involved in cell wall biosynthesis
MKVVHLSTGHLGGAGLAARRINQVLNSIGVNSEFLALEQKSFKIVENEAKIQRTFFIKLKSFFVRQIEKRFTEKVLFSSLSISANHINFFRNLSNNKTVVLHFHNWSNLISQDDLIRLVNEGYPICITLHDERLLTGGCHYKIDCNRINQGCTPCPLASQLLRPFISHNHNSIRKIINKDLKNLVIISPSIWLKKEVERYFNLSSNQVVHIPNSLGTLWNPNRYFYESIQPEKIKIGIASMDSQNYIKAGDVINSLVNDVELTRSISFLMLNKISKSQEHFEKFWTKIDYLLVVSRADNSPNVIHEAKSLGISIIASEVGGIVELLSEGYDVVIPKASNNFNQIKEILLRIDKPNLEFQQKMIYEFQNYLGRNTDVLVSSYNKILNNDQH